MKKRIGIILVVCMLIVTGSLALSCVDVAEQPQNDQFQLVSVEQLRNSLMNDSAEIEDIADLGDFVIEVLIGIYDDPSYNWDISVNCDLGIDATMEEVDAFITKHRNALTEFYIAYNEAAVEKIGLTKYNYTVACFGPYIEITFSGAEEYTKHRQELQKLINNNKDTICSVGVYSNLSFQDEADVNSRYYFANYPLSDAFDDIGTSNSTYTGNGIKVGTIETGVPNSTANLVSGKYQLLGSTVTEHSTVVTSIIGGTSGIARDVYLYCKPYSNFLNDTNLLYQTYHVNVINISFGYVAVKGLYKNIDACIDNFISHSGCTVVIAAGNHGHNDAKVASPACSVDAITVGNVSKNKKICSSSSWITDDAALYKPDVVAPGDTLWDIPNIANVSDDGVYGQTGTSFATPMVTGTIALLMEEFPVLKTSPALVKSVVHLGAVQLPSQTDYFDAQAGFGLINYPNMRNILQSTAYQEFSVLANSANGNTVKSFNVTIPYENRISVNANLIVNSNVTIEEDELAQMVYTNYCIKIYNTATDNCVATSNINSPMDYLLYTNTNPLNNSFRIDIVLTSDNSNHDVENGAFAYEIENLHSHSYNSFYATYSTTQHKSFCDCGDYVLEGHVVPAGAFSNGNRFAICLVCGGRATSGYVVHPNTSELYHTANGSYILPNGVIVLVDADMEAFWAGTLHFIAGSTM